MHLLKKGLLLCLSLGVLPLVSFAQQLKITDFVIFGGNGNCPTGQGQKAPALPGCGVVLASKTTIIGGSIGGFGLLQADEKAALTANLFFGGNSKLGEKATINGRIANINIAVFKGNVLDIGKDASITGNMDINGSSIVASGSSVKGKVTHPVGTLYSGPVPTLGNITAVPSLPILPLMPAITTFPAAGTLNITTSKVLTPGAYGNLTIGDKQTVTFSGTGVYIFKLIKNTCEKNSFVFDFKNSPTGKFYIYVYGDVELNRPNIQLLNGGNGLKICSETHSYGTAS